MWPVTWADGAVATGNVYLRRFHDERQLTTRESHHGGDGAVDLVRRTRHYRETSNGAQTSGKESDGPCESLIGLAVPVIDYLDAGRLRGSAGESSPTPTSS